MNNNSERQSTFLSSMVILMIITAIIVIGIIVMKADTQIVLFMCCVACAIYCCVYLKISWSEVEAQIIKNIAESIQAMIIIMLIGAVVASWIACGTVPYIIYWGLKIISPSLFLISSLIICCILSIMTGSSWTTMGTVGVALMGVGAGLGMPAGMTAGAIICGAYFGDKQSPLSDTANFSASVAKADLYEHVKSMIYTTGPAIIVASIIFIFMGFKFSGQSTDVTAINTITGALSNAFNFNISLLIPPIVLIILILKKVPAIVGMSVAVLLGWLLSIIAQGTDLASSLIYIQRGFVGATGNELVDKLLTRGGFNSMMGTILLMFLSLAIAGMLERSGVLQIVLSKVTNIIKRRFGLISTTLFSGIALSFIAADPYIAMLLPAKTFGESYDKQGIERTVLSRTIQDGGVVIAPIVPWGSNGMYTVAALGVSVAEFLPYYIFGWACPLFSLICAFTGIGVFYKKKDE